MHGEERTVLDGGGTVHDGGAILQDPGGTVHNSALPLMSKACIVLFLNEVVGGVMPEPGRKNNR